MNNDTQIQHHIWWIIKTIGTLPPTFRDFKAHPLSSEVCEEIDALVAYIKTNY